MRQVSRLCHYQEKEARSFPESEVIFIGDGLLSDTCAARNAADTVFATGRLFDYCIENDIKVTEFGEDFGPVLKYVMNKTSTDGDQ